MSIAMTGAGGSGVMTAGQMLLHAAAGAGLLGQMTRSSGPQIRGGEAAAFVMLAPHAIDGVGDLVDIHLAFDWMNVDRFSAELPLNETSTVLYEASAGDVPEVIASSGARLVPVAFKKVAKGIQGGRPNMVGLGMLSVLTGVPAEQFLKIVHKSLARKGEEAIKASEAAINAGIALAADLDVRYPLDGDWGSAENERWNMSGNEAAGLGALRGGVRFVAAYPITPATEVLEWLAPNLEKVGGSLVQAEDELASIGMIIGGSFGGVPAMTATSGPGLALMMESIGLAVASETPIMIVDVQRGGPSTGIPTKSEQSDLNIALYGLHGDAPHIVTAANSIADCLFTAQWSVYLAEQLQTAAILLTDQSLGQSRAVVEKPADLAFVGKRATMDAGTEDYLRYAVNDEGVSPMAIPGTAGGQYVADGLEHSPNGRPSSQTEDHSVQLDKRHRKLADFDFGDHWATIQGEGEIAILTWGSSTGPCREAIRRHELEGHSVRLISPRLLMPVQEEAMAEALDGVKKLLIVEQTHSKQFYRYLRAHYDLPDEVAVFNQPGPIAIRPAQVHAYLKKWS
ncbi:2-oxoacid:acceptor oxidoreductase subunit alpha [Magnetospira sp. QH-2]|uniref:2-oxoacid:acceptor oxidoreductase subunit alpha n=1 Tax=Magnetospira sp. (strain QH-2) TaxID=1288970 RepID=UPI00352714DC